MNVTRQAEGRYCQRFFMRSGMLIKFLPTDTLEDSDHSNILKNFTAISGPNFKRTSILRKYVQSIVGIVITYSLL